MWKKMWTWIKKYSHYIVLALAGIGGFIIGRRSVGTSSDFEQLRADNRQLVREIDSLRENYNRLIALNKLNEQQLADIAKQLDNAERFIEESGKFFDGNRTDIEGLSETNKRLREWIQKYGNQIQDK